MKNKFTSLSYLLVMLLMNSAVNSLSAQITVDDNDFANAGDTARMSEAVWNPLLDYSTTDSNTIWDYSTLVWQSQYIDTFQNILFTNPLYAFYFSNTFINPHRSNIATRGGNILTGISFLTVTFTDPYNFYYKSTDSYRLRGIGMKVAGFPTSIGMNHSDTIYRFPMNYGDADTSHSDYKVNVPQLGTYVHKQIRYNKVDGWGTLITPFGTFQTLRQVSEIRGSDSLYIDTLNFGFKIDNDIQREYKWIGKGDKEPLLVITTQAGILGLFQNFEFVTKVVYRDSLRFHPVVSGIVPTYNDAISFTVLPNPSKGLFYISVPVSLNNAKFAVSDINGQVIMKQFLNSSVEVINAEEWAKGIYIITLQSMESISSKKLVIN
jgi:hypothetical protein